MVNYKKISSLPVFLFVSLQVSIRVKGKERFKLEHWRIPKNVKCYIVIAIIAVMLISIFGFLSEKSVTHPNVISKNTDDSTSSEQAFAAEPQAPKEESITDSLISIIQPVMSTFFPKEPGLIKSAQSINSSVWMQVAANAWAFYTPDVGVDSVTGLPYAASSDFRGFTDWDLGSYIQAIIDAQEIGLIDINGNLGSYARFNAVLTFLENRPLNAYGYPFQFYDATTGDMYYPASKDSTIIVDIVDTGRLFVALNNLRNLNNAFAPRINRFVLNGRSNYTALVPSILNDVNSNSIYAYYIYSGFASFWPQQLGAVPSTILSNILNSQNITTYGVTLPNAPICNEPLLSAVFELDNNDSPRLMGLMTQVYLACEAYYNSTGRFMAPSEGSNGGAWLYEWVVAPNGEPWIITNASQTVYSSPSIVYNKVAFSYLAFYNTSFARNMVVWLEDALPNPINGYYEGIDNHGNTNPYPYLSNIANTLILEAARYALQKV
jgi:hypothetical protein